MMPTEFTPVYEEVPQEEGGGYVAYAKEFPGAITQGETLEEALENLRDAVEMVLEANSALANE
jgi:predicted RNase H-like HicB family nuclease